MSSSSPPPSTPTMPTLPPTNTTTVSPPLSATSSPTSLSGRRTQTPLSLDLNNIPPLSTPAPPSNTLLITRLSSPIIFHPASLATIREHLSTLAPLNSFSPLKSLSRIIVSFHDTASAITVRQAIDGTAFLGDCVAKCYFGEPTPIGDATKYLERPDAGRLFFISPPPSPPIGWSMRNEDPPNKEVHADDLAQKLARLTGKMTSDANADDELYTREELTKLKTHHPQPHPAPHTRPAGDDASPTKISSRSRSSTLIYDPKAHGDSPGLPAVMLETEDDSEVELAVPERTITAHTSRPPVELME